MNGKGKVLAAKPNFGIAFDVGHSSIGWAVLQTEGRAEIAGCGAVTFRADDCLASARRGYRRQRRHIRSTRQRIARMKVLLKHLGALKPEQLDQPGCAWPWQLAARVLCGGKLLTWPELWDVLRWYAHNRGYDGNRRWSAADAEAIADDTEKEENAKTLMGKHRVGSMAETFCMELGVDPLGQKRASTVRFKGLNAAFPRAIVEGEVRRILQAHSGKLPKVDAALERALLGRDNRDRTAWQSIPCPALRLPKRYEGALLFGQLVPRFDNRIISKCPVSGEKVPSRNCAEFLNFRWAMQLANVRVARFGEKELTPLTAPERRQLDAAMRKQGGMGAEEFKKHVRQAAGAIRDNLDTMLLHPDAKEALLLDPVQKIVQSSDLRPLWQILPERLQKRARGQLRRGKTITPARLRAQLEELGLSVSAFDAEVTRQLDAANTRNRKNDERISRQGLLNRPFAAKRLDGRAAFARPLLKRAAEEVMAGKHPKEEGGCLFVTEEMRQAQLSREIAEQTNNHLVRHRLLILERLVGDIIKEYAGGDKARVAGITVEVNRDLREMSGMTAKQKAQDLGLRIANHHHVVKKLEEDESLMRVLRKQGTRITAGLIRKARVADDLGWACPYTGQRFEPVDLVTKRVDKDHIVPRASRASDSLESLVMTFSAINKWKGKRTAWQFVEQEQGKPVPDLPNLSITSLSRYKQLVESIETFKGHDDDKRRKKRRKDLMLLPVYEEKEFTPRDLTTTSQLVRLGAMALRKAFLGCKRQPVVVSLPGSVTGAVRKAWKVLGCLSLAAPGVLDENGEVKKKQEIREVTHLHHALDACVLALASHFIPNNGRIWELIVKGRWTPAEERELKTLGIFSWDSEGRFQVRDLDKTLKEQIRQRLGERRVVQHIPARMEGLRVEQNTWRVVSVKDGEATLRQRVRAADGSRPGKTTAEKVTKLLGLQPVSGRGKLLVNRGTLVIPDNFGVALVEPEPVIIPFHKVWPRLSELRAANGGRMPMVLRNGQLIRVPGGKSFKGVWRVFATKNNASGMALDIGSPDVVRLKNKTEGHKINVRLATLIRDGMEVLRTPLTGFAACPAPSSP
ncbi:MAG: type II CRISPR RNA-guided endonuclease Cas9 [Verrucomicrobiota bacterium]|jgi:CRISPR-associated endonuclease Csn1